MVRWYLGLGVILFSSSAAAGLAAQDSMVDDSKEKVITARAIGNRIVIDGELDEAEWDLAEPVSDFFQQEPATGEPVSERTEVRLLYNDEFLYVGIYCFDSQGSKGIVLSGMRRDFNPFDGDVFNIALDTFNDDRNGYLFTTSPVGAKHDSQIGDNGGKINPNWDGIWYAQSKITESGWQGEMAIPFKTLRFRNTEQQVWGVNFQRRIRRKNENSMWAAVPRPYSISRLSPAGKLEGLGGIRPGRNLYVKPYISLPVTRRQEDDVDFEPDVGLDVKYGLSSELTLDLTVNTDFSQVEADNQQINLTRFSLFFPEKREFFLENRSFFQFGPTGTRGPLGAYRDLIPFFSRRIGLFQGSPVPIWGGARLSGRISDYTLGLLSIQVDDFQEVPSTNFSVVRVHRDLFRTSNIGVIFVNKQKVDGDFNRTYGADANFTFYNRMDVSSFFVKTSTPGVPDKDMAGFFSLGWKSQLMTAEAAYLLIQENFNAEVGFVPRVGVRKTTGSFSLRPRPRERIPSIREFEPSISVIYLTDPDNVLETRTIDSSFTIRFQYGSSISFGVQSNFERLTDVFTIRSDPDGDPAKDIEILEGDYPFNVFNLSLSSDRSRMFSGNFSAETGDFYDGDKSSYRFGLRFQIQPWFRTELSWSHDDVNLPSGDFYTDLISATLNYNFNPSMFVNALIQYNSESREIRSNIRFNLIHKPLSDFFLVYNEGRSSTNEVRERALIAKVTYLVDL